MGGWFGRLAGGMVGRPLCTRNAQPHRHPEGQRILVHCSVCFCLLSLSFPLCFHPSTFRFKEQRLHVEERFSCLVSWFHAVVPFCPQTPFRWLPSPSFLSVLRRLFAPLGATVLLAPFSFPLFLCCSLCLLSPVPCALSLPFPFCNPFAWSCFDTATISFPCPAFLPLSIFLLA